MKLPKSGGCQFPPDGGNVKELTMIVEGQGIGFWTGVRLPSAPLACKNDELTNGFVIFALHGLSSRFVISFFKHFTILFITHIASRPFICLITYFITKEELNHFEHSDNFGQK